jgi:hypothetical protein
VVAPKPPRDAGAEAYLQPDDYDENINLLPEADARDIKIEKDDLL